MADNLSDKGTLHLGITPAARPGNEPFALPLTPR